MISLTHPHQAGSTLEETAEPAIVSTDQSLAIVQDPTSDLEDV